MNETSAKLLNNHSLKIVYFAVLLYLLFLVVWYLSYLSVSSEKLEGNQIYTAGANMRMLGQEFTSTNQGENTIVYNDELRNWNDYKKERLVNQRGEPDFWEINNTLNAYKEEQIPGYIN